MILSRRKYKPKKTRLGSYFKISKKRPIFYRYDFNSGYPATRGSQRGWGGIGENGRGTFLLHRVSKIGVVKVVAEIGYCCRMRAIKKR